MEIQFKILPMCGLILVTTTVMLIEYCSISDGVTVKSCQWTISVSGYMSCHVVYGRKTSAASITVRSKIATKNDNSNINITNANKNVNNNNNERSNKITSNSSRSAICDWPNGTVSMNQLKMVHVSCDLDTSGSSTTLAAEGVRPLIDSETFEIAPNLEYIDIRNTPLKSTLAWDAFCRLPRVFREITFRDTQLVDMDDIGFGRGHGDEDDHDFDSCPTADHLQELWIFDNDIKVLRKRGPLSRLKRLKILAFVDNRLENIETEAFANLVDVEYIFLNNNSLTKLSNETFKMLSKLGSLELEGNRLSRLERGCFAGLDNLYELYLQKNRIKEVDNETFAGMPRLRRLDLSGNAGVRIASGTFWILANTLETLKLNDNELTTRTLTSESSLEGLHNLKELHLSNNSIANQAHRDNDGIKSTLAMMPLLVLLDMSSNRLTRLSEMMFSKQVKLKRLEINDNLVENIEDNLFANDATEISLETFLLGNNRLRRIPGELGKLVTLVVLDLSDNLIEHVDNETFSNLVNLRRLNVRGNRLVELADNIFGTLAALVYLDLSDNRIRLVGNSTFAGLVELKQLQLQNNGHLNLSRNFYEFSVPPWTFKNVTYRVRYKMLDILKPMESLLELNLSGVGLEAFEYYWFPINIARLVLSDNNISKISAPIVRFPQMKKLFHLDLSGNRIETVGAGSFPATSLSTLKLDGNRVSSLADDTFKYMHKLRSVSLRGNKLTTLKIPSVYVVDTALATLKFALANNPFVCDCALAWIRADSKGMKYEIVDYQKLTCQTAHEKGSSTTTVELVTSVAEESFLCQFEEDHLPTRACLMANSFLYCAFACPRQCRCYKNADKTWILLDCTGTEPTRSSKVNDNDNNNNNLVLFPSDLPLKTTVLYLDNNDLSRLEGPDLRWLTSLRRLYLNHNLIETVSTNSFASLEALEILHLDHNLLEQLPTPSDDDDDNYEKSGRKMFASLKSLSILDLSFNRLSNLSAGLFDPLIKLKSLKLNDNLLINLPVWTSLDNLPLLSEVGLQGNPWSCDCDYALSLRQWIRNFTGKILDKQNLYCALDDGKAYASLILFNVSDCYEKTGANGSRYFGDEEGTDARKVTVFMTPSWQTKLWVAVFPTVVILVFMLLVLYYRRELEVLVYSRYGMRLFHEADEGKYDADKVYDAFVSYSTLDEDFVVDQLIPGLENIDHPYTLCLHHRDFPIGAFINESIFDAIATSRRTILVLSKNFVHSEWCRFEFRTAHSQMLMDRCKRVIVVLFGEMPDELDAEMKLYLRTNTYLAWGDLLFWKKLYFALPDHRQAEQRPLQPP